MPETNSSERLILLPGDIEFERTLATPPPNWREVANQTNGVFALVACSESGLLRAVNGINCQEYLLGGEYEERLSSMWEMEDEDCQLEDLEGVEELYIDW